MEIQGRIIFKGKPNERLINSLLGVGISIKKKTDGTYVVSYESREYINANVIAVLQSSVKSALPDILEAEIKVYTTLWSFKK